MQWRNATLAVSSSLPLTSMHKSNRKQTIVVILKMPVHIERKKDRKSFSPILVFPLMLYLSEIAVAISM